MGSYQWTLCCLNGLVVWALDHPPGVPGLTPIVNSKFNSAVYFSEVNQINTRNPSDLMVKSKLLKLILKLKFLLVSFV